MLRACTLALLALAAPAFADKAASLADYLPANTPVFLQVRNPTAAELKESCIGKALHDPEVQALLSSLFGGEAGAASEVPLGGGTFSMVGEFKDGVMGVRVRFKDAAGTHEIVMRDGFAFAWVGLQMAAFPVDVVAAADVDDAPAAAQALTRMLTALYGEVAGAAAPKPSARPLFEKLDHKGVGYFAGQLGPVEVCVAPLGKLLVVTSGRDRARHMIDLAQAGPAGSLAQDPRFRAVVDGAPGTGTATTILTIQVDRALDVAATHFPGPVMFVRQWLGNLGLDGLQGLSTVARVDGRGVSSRTTVHFKGPRDKGLGRLFAGGEPATFEGLAFAPKDSLYVWSGRLDVTGLFDIVAEALGSTGQMGPAIWQAQFQRTFDLNLKEDLLDLVGPEMTFVVAASGGLIPDVGFIVESPDAARLQRSLLHMLEKADWPDQTGVHTYRSGDTTVYTVPLLHPQLVPVPLSPTFGVVEGKLLLTLHPLGYQRCAAVRAGRLEGLAQSRDFAQLRERVPANARDMSYLDLRRLYSLCYQTLMPVLQSMPHPSGISPLATLPPAAPILDQLYGRIAWRTADDKGIHWHSHGSADTSGVFVMMAAGAGAAAFLLYETAEAPPTQIAVAPPVHEHDGRPRDVRICRANCRVLKARILLYQQEHGRLPGSLDDLKAKHLDPDTFFVPGTDKVPYTYLGPDAPGDILLYGAPNGLDGRITVLAKDLGFKRLTAEELERQLR